LNLESILKEVADLKLVDAEAIKKELLKRVKIDNYVASGADDDYSRALFKEYRRQFGDLSKEVNRDNRREALAERNKK